MAEITTLSNGLRVIMERMPHLRSVSIGVWVKAGSMLESPEENGLSHLMEHMAFKRTQHRSARELAQEMDAIGGHMNAATSKLYTNYYVARPTGTCPGGEPAGRYLRQPGDRRGGSGAGENVVIEEIAMVEDSPEDLLFDLTSEATYSGQSRWRASPAAKSASPAIRRTICCVSARNITARATP